MTDLPGELADGVEVWGEGLGGCFRKALNLLYFVVDVAVGAPYDDDGAGKVFIYHGAAEGIKVKPAQVSITLISPLCFLLLHSPSFKFSNI